MQSEGLVRSKVKIAATGPVAGAGERRPLPIAIAWFLCSKRHEIV